MAMDTQQQLPRDYQRLLNAIQKVMDFDASKYKDEECSDGAVDAAGDLFYESCRVSSDVCKKFEELNLCSGAPGDKKDFCKNCVNRIFEKTCDDNSNYKFCEGLNSDSTTESGSTTTIIVVVLLLLLALLAAGGAVGFILYRKKKRNQLGALAPVAPVTPPASVAPAPVTPAAPAAPVAAPVEAPNTIPMGSLSTATARSTATATQQPDP